MIGFHFRQIATRLARVPRDQRRVIAGLLGLGLAVVGLILIELIGPAIRFWRGGTESPRPGCQATRADSPSWERAVVPAVIYSPQVNAPTTVLAPPPMPVAIPPSVEAGPEVFLLATPASPAAAMPSEPTMRSPEPQAPAVKATLPVLAQPTAPLPSGGGPRSEAMEKIAAQSDQQIRHGFELASRGAYFAARAEFTAALRLIAQGLDNEQNTNAHSRALSAALTAMQESQDFVPTRGKLEGDIDLPPIIASHSTPVLKDAAPKQLQAMRAVKQYLTFAQAQLALAAGQEVSGSMALAALGKMHAALAGRPNPEIVLPEAKSVTFLQAAILVCPRNYIAANELGVLLAHNGDYAGARRILEHSVLACRSFENLSNLSVVYRQIGELRLSALAAEKAQVARACETTRQKGASLSAGGSVTWVDPSALADNRYMAPAGQWSDPPAKSMTPAGQPTMGTWCPPMQSQPVIGLTPSPYGPTTAH
jgi:tetratricopeptide (TPR) repeat protein